MVSSSVFKSEAIGFKTPEEVWKGTHSDYSYLKVFGCLAYAHVKQDKLEARAVKCLFLGYPKGVKGYKLWCLEPGINKCIISRDVIFYEDVMPLLRNTDSVMKTLSEVEPVKDGVPGTLNME